MRIAITFDAPRFARIGYDYNYPVFLAIQDWLGRDNKWHGMRPAPFCFSTIRNLQADAGGLTVAGKPQLLVSSAEAEFIADLLCGIGASKQGPFGWTVADVAREKEPDFEAEARFFAASPIVLKHSLPTGGMRYVSWNDCDADEELTWKLRDRTGDKALHARFDGSYKNARTKLTRIVKSRAARPIQVVGSVCPIVVQAQPATLARLYAQGAGSNTGMGFGFLTV